MSLLRGAPLLRGWFCVGCLGSRSRLRGRGGTWSVLSSWTWFPGHSDRQPRTEAQGCSFLRPIPAPSPLLPSRFLGPPTGPSPQGVDTPSQRRVLLRAGNVQAAVLLRWPPPGRELCAVWPHAVWAASGLGPGQLWIRGASLATCHMGSRRSLEAFLMTQKIGLPAVPPSPAAQLALVSTSRQRAPACRVCA